MHTIEVDDHDARWLLDALRWAKESSETKGLRRNVNHLSKAQTTVTDQLPPYEELEA